MRQKPRVIAPREDASEREWRRQVAEAIREIGRFLDLGIGVGQLRGELIELEVEGDDVDITKRISPATFKGKPYGVWVLEVTHSSSAAPGSMGGTIPWKYKTVGNEPHIQFLNFPGLAAGEKYRIKVFVIAGDG